MFIRTNPGGKCVRSQPAAAIIATPKKGRNQTILTNLTVGTDFYIALNTKSTDPAAGPANFDFILQFGKPAVVIDNWTGFIFANPAPTAGQINVSEMCGSTYTAA